MKVGFVILSHGNFGGAQRRYFNLFFHLNKRLPESFFFFVTDLMYNQLSLIFPNEDLSNVFIVETIGTNVSSGNEKTETGISNKNTFRNKIFSLIKRTYPYKIYKHLKNKKLARRTFLNIDKIVSEKNITALNGIYSGIIPLYFYLSNKKRRPKIIFSNMDSWLDNISNHKDYNWYEKYFTFNFAHTNSDIVDFLSPFILKGIQKMEIPIDQSKVKICPCSFTNYDDCLIGLKKKFIITFSGRLEKDKNPILFLEVAHSIAKKRPEVEFYIMGDGRLAIEAKTLVSSFDLNNIKYLNFHPKPTDILSDSILFVSIQTTNNYPSQSVLEAMACGNAIIASDVGDTRMFVNEENGTLISLDKKSLEDSILFYIDNPEIARRKGSYNAQYVRKNFTIEKVSNYYLELFN